MLESKRWKKIPDRLQNAYSNLSKRSPFRSYKLSPAALRSKLPPVNPILPQISTSSISALNDYNFSTHPAPEDDESSLVHAELEDFIATSLQKYPKLALSIKKLEKEKIHCKCSVFSKNKFSLDRVHGFSAVACASEFCINRILEEPEEPIKSYTKSPKYYSLSPEKRVNQSCNQELVLFDQSIDSVNRAVKYVHTHEHSENEYKNVYDEYIRQRIFNVPRHNTRSPNFSMPKAVARRNKTELM